MVYNICVISLYFSEIFKLSNYHTFFPKYIKTNSVNTCVAISTTLSTPAPTTTTTVPTTPYIIRGKLISFIQRFLLKKKSALVFIIQTRVCNE